jgi:hypothetical protein
MPTLPEKRYVRRGHIIAWLGIDKREVARLVKAGVFRPLYLRGRGRAFFLRAEVVAAVDAGLVFTPTKSATA